MALSCPSLSSSWVEIMAEGLALSSPKNGTTTSTLQEYFGTKKTRGVDDDTMATKTCCASPASSTMTAATCTSSSSLLEPSTPWRGEEEDALDFFLRLQEGGVDADNLDSLLAFESECGHDTNDNHDNHDHDSQLGYDGDDHDDDGDSDSLLLLEEEEEAKGIMLEDGGGSGHSLSLSSGSSRQEDVDLEFVHQLEVAFMTDIGNVSRQLEVLHKSDPHLGSDCGSHQQRGHQTKHVNMHHNREQEHDHHHDHHHRHDKGNKKKRTTGAAATSLSLGTLPTASWDTEEEEDYEEDYEEEEYQDNHLNDYRSYEHPYEQHDGHGHQYHHHHHHYHHYHHHYHHYDYRYDGEESGDTPSPNKHHNVQTKLQQHGESAGHGKQEIQEQEKHTDTRQQKQLPQPEVKQQDFDTLEASLLEEEIELGLQELERILRDLDEDIYDPDDTRRPSNMTQKTPTDNPRDPVMTKATRTEDDSTSNRRVSRMGRDPPLGISPQIMNEFLVLDQFLQEELHDMEETVHVLDSHNKDQSQQQDDGRAASNHASRANDTVDKSLVTVSTDVETTKGGHDKDWIIGSASSSESGSLLSYVWGNQWHHPKSTTTTTLADCYSILGRHLLYKTIVPCLYRQQCVWAKTRKTTSTTYSYDEDDDENESLVVNSSTNGKSLAPARIASATAAAAAAIGTVVWMASVRSGLGSTARRTR